MKNLINWDKKTWLSSSKYTLNIINFLEKRIKFNKEIKILDIGCGRGKIVSTLSTKYQMNNLPIGIDIVDHKDISKKIRFVKINALRHLRTTKEKFDFILFKQSIHFFKFIEIKKILNFSKKKLNPNGKIINLIKFNFKKYQINYFNFKVKITKDSYLQMIKNKFTSCLLDLSSEELKTGMNEIKKKYKKKLVFNDKLICISYKKK